MNNNIVIVNVLLLNYCIFTFREEIRGQIRDLKKEMSGANNKVATESENKPVENKTGSETNEMMKQYEDEQLKYKEQMSKLPKKGPSRLVF